MRSENERLLERTLDCLKECYLDASDYKSVLAFEKLTKLLLSLQKAIKKDNEAKPVIEEELTL